MRFPKKPDRHKPNHLANTCAGSETHTCYECKVQGLESFSTHKFVAEWNAKQSHKDVPVSWGTDMKNIHLTSDVDNTGCFHQVDKLSSIGVITAPIVLFYALLVQTQTTLLSGVVNHPWVASAICIHISAATPVWCLGTSTQKEEVQIPNEMQPRTSCAPALKQIGSRAGQPANPWTETSFPSRKNYPAPWLTSASANKR